MFANSKQLFYKKFNQFLSKIENQDRHEIIRLIEEKIEGLRPEKFKIQAKFMSLDFFIEKDFDKEILLYSIDSVLECANIIQLLKVLKTAHKFGEKRTIDLAQNLIIERLIKRNKVNLIEKIITEDIENFSRFHQKILLNLNDIFQLHFKNLESVSKSLSGISSYHLSHFLLYSVRDIKILKFEIDEIGQLLDFLLKDINERDVNVFYKLLLENFLIDLCCVKTEIIKFDEYIKTFVKLGKGELYDRLSSVLNQFSIKIQPTLILDFKSLYHQGSMDQYKTLEHENEFEPDQNIEAVTLDESFSTLPPKENSQGAIIANESTLAIINYGKLSSPESIELKIKNLLEDITGANSEKERFGKIYSLVKIYIEIGKYNLAQVEINKVLNDDQASSETKKYFVYLEEKIDQRINES